MCETLRDWNAAGYELVPVSVNVSRADIYQSHLADSFCRLVETYGISPQLLHLEITESAYTDQPEQKERLQAMGCDYAQGYFFAKPMSAEEFEVLLKKRQV